MTNPQHPTPNSNPSGSAIVFPWKIVSITVLAMLGLILAVIMVAGGGGSEKSAPKEAPIVTQAKKITGMTLPDAERSTRDAGYGFSDEPLNGLLGVQVRENWTVCRAVPQGETSIVAFVGKGDNCSDSRAINDLIRDKALDKGLEKGLDAVLAPR